MSSALPLLRARLLAFAVVVGGIMMGCRSDSEPGASERQAPTLASTADSVANRLRQAHGADALASAPYLRFTFAVKTPAGRRVLGHHFWDRITGDYRVEWTVGTDSSYVVLFNVRDATEDAPGGTVYLNGTRVDGTAAERRARDAYGRFINDTYWVLAPVKVFDPGVNRAYVPDSSTAEHDVLHLTFGDVGLTPGDEYWLYVSTESGRLDQWAFHLQGMDESTPPQRFDWTADTTLQAPEGPVTLARRKDAVDGKKTILTTNLSLPERPPTNVFSAPDPMLDPHAD